MWSEGFVIEDGVLKLYGEELMEECEDEFEEDDEPYEIEGYCIAWDLCAKYGVRGIWRKAEVEIPEGVTKIGDGAFEFRDWLTDVTIPDSVTEIGDDAFWDCSNLKSITIPEGVTKIGESAFKDCTKLASVTIPESVEEIDDGAFCGCSSLESITIPETVEILGDDIFGGCTNLSNLIVPDRILSEKASLTQLHQFFDIANAHDLTELKMRIMRIKHERFPKDEQQENDFLLD